MNIGFDLDDFASQCGIPDIEKFRTQMIELYKLLSEYNDVTNVTRITDEPEFWSKHVADSFAIGRFFPELAESQVTLADIGCGAGFPSLVLAAAWPGLDITAIDSIGRKTRFVELAAEKLGLNNLKVVTARSKELLHLPEWKERFDIVTARAVADARKLFRETRTLVKKEGRFIFYKTPSQVKDDLPQVVSASKQYGCDWLISEEFELPGAGGARQFLYSK